MLATRTGLRPDDPEPQIVAATLIGLWRLQFRSLRTHLCPGRSLADAIDAVTAEVRRAARLVEEGLATFPEPAEVSDQAIRTA